MTDELPDSARRVQLALMAAGIPARVVQLPRSARTARDAAAAIGCLVEQIAKSLVFRRADSDRPVLVIASGLNRVDERLAASHLNAGIAKADAAFVRSSTGFAIGGVPPLGHDAPVETLIDQDLLQFDTVWAAAGTPHAVFAIDPRQLVRATGGRVLAVAASHEGSVSAGRATRHSETLMFLPGASGNAEFWKPVAARLRHPGARRFVSWPGLGGAPPEAGVTGIRDLVARVARDITGPVDVLAQSMGGIVAVRAALARPELVRHLVLSVTSGGIDVAALGARDWRPAFTERHPDLPRWFVDEREDLTERLREIAVPVLLLWGDADPISPLAVGQRLAGLFPDARLVVVEGGTHDLVQERAADVAPHIDAHLDR
jgi:prolyl-tRNA editing enzyme YbaK/EbsC (Cys-tRNA(Pro) deacylase)